MARPVTVLVVDPGEFSQRLIRQYLALEGYASQGLKDASAAARLLSERPRGFDLVLLDAGADIDSAIEGAERILQLHPAIPMIVLSRQTPIRDRLPAGADFLPRPFSPPELAAAIHRRLGRPLDAHANEKAPNRRVS
jgi:DNA-binding response OmpR family regulator